MRYAQLVVGPCGVEKTTYCAKMKEHCSVTKRNVFLVNMDPANETMQYTPDVDIRNVISLEEVMREERLGPNGGPLRCMHYLADNLEWLEEELERFGESAYFIFDMPGQLELYSHDLAMQRLVSYFKASAFSAAPYI